MAASQQHIVEK